MRGKHALAADFFDIFSANRFSASLFRFFAQQVQRQQGRVALVHVVSRQICVSQRAQHPHSTDAEQHLLAQTVIGITAIKAPRKIAVALVVRRQVRIQKIHWHIESAHALGVIAPGA